MTMIGRLVRFGRRQLHTIISREIIKPSSPTPSHLKTHNLSLLDQIGTNTFIPMVLFYASTDRSSQDKTTLDLKNSLSQTLTKYYPFAGRHPKTAPAYVDCNDEGAEFLEAFVDSKLEDFLRNSQHEDLNQFFPHRLVFYESNRADHDLQSDTVIPLAVQVNHFECGGVAVTVSLSHKIADGSSLGHFVNDWAKMTRFCSKGQKELDDVSINPQFIPFPQMNMNFEGFSLERSNDCVTRSFMFPNSKINDLKLKVAAMTAESGEPVTNPTRVEVLSWLIYKCSMAACIKNNPRFKSIGVGQLTNIRGKMIEPLPENTIGNLFMTMEILRNNETEISPQWFISEFKKQKIQFEGLRNIETVLGFLTSMASETALVEQQRKIDNTYICTSMCGYPGYEIDFGWGKPVKATIAGNLRKNSVILMDSPNRDGVEALVCLEKQDMAVFRTDPELLPFC